MTYNEYLHLMLNAALDIKAGNFDEGYGICYNIENKVDRQVQEECYEAWRILNQAFYTWPKFSGDVQFPINDPCDEVSANHAYVYLPKWVGEYGELRWELLDHVIDFLKKEIEKCNQNCVS